LAQAQTEGYDPENPPQPNWPEEYETKYYTVFCEAIPNGAGQFGYNANQKVKPGYQASIYAYDHNDCYFIEWKDAEGNTVSTNRSYSFTMPNSDVKFYAIYSYTPGNPIDPVMSAKYLLTLKSDPAVAGSFNFKDQKITEGTTQNLHAYSNSGFKFVNWTDETNAVVSDKADLSFLMPSHNVTLTAHYEYAPEMPQEPGNRHQHKHYQDISHQPHGIVADEHARPAQQGHRGAQCLLALVGHSSGRRAEEHPDL